MSDIKKKKINIRTILSVFLLTAGLLLVLVPLIMTYYNTKRNNDIIEEFLRESELVVSELESMEIEDVDPIDIIPVETQTENIPHDPPAVESPDNNPTPEATEQPAPTETPSEDPFRLPTKKPKMTKEEMKKRTTGILIIPKIDVKMLIMDGTDDATLSVAVGRMTNTDNFDEVGNCVLAGHRSYTFGKYLNRLNELEAGDKITVQLKNKTLTYTVYKSHIIEPTDFSILNRNGTDKILTIFTCHPPGVGSHRLVVHAKQDE
ncbi:MAG TPA: sortase [Clostridiaceae bacterium]|nr:sortase [Clostridiaceae bacterium]